MIKDLINNFYQKYPEKEAQYIREHSSRWTFIAKNWLQDKDYHQGDFLSIDVGGGNGAFFEHIGLQGGFVVDGCVQDFELTERRNVSFVKADLNIIDQLPFYDHDLGTSVLFFNLVFCMETLEHLSNPYVCLDWIKKIMQEDAELIISIPHERMLHNTIYPALFYPESNFEEFLAQMAFEVVDKLYFTDGFPSVCYRLRSHPYSNKRLKFPKNEEKFMDCSPLDATNL